MQQLSTDLIIQASRVFVSLSYAGGQTAMPQVKRAMLELPVGQNFFDCFAANEAVRDCCQIEQDKKGIQRIVLVRLGSDHYRNLKLKAQRIDDKPQENWLFSVDTHDGFSATSFLPPSDHPDAAAWLQLQAANVALKEKIEAAWDKAGILTFNGLLRRDLEIARPSFS